MLSQWTRGDSRFQYFGYRPIYCMLQFQLSLTALNQLRFFIIVFWFFCWLAWTHNRCVMHMLQGPVGWQGPSGSKVILFSSFCFFTIITNREIRYCLPSFVSCKQQLSHKFTIDIKLIKNCMQTMLHDKMLDRRIHVQDG